MRRAGKLVEAAGLVLLLGTYSGASGETQVVFTVDVESTEAFPLPRQVDPVCEDGSACGLMEISRMLEERGWRGTFFLNVYENRSWGESAMRDIAAKLQAAGQDVALHTHPHWAFDPTRPEMYQYSLDEQTSIIREGVKLLTAWTGRPVVAHRAGDYAADERTLEALERNGLGVDSSLFWGHPHCRLTEPGLRRNLPAWHGRLIEIPVTVYQREERPWFFGEILEPVISIRKIDADWLLDSDEARAAVDAVTEANLPYLVVFLHSFSFLADPAGDGMPVADRQSLDVFRAILDRVRVKHLPVVTMRDLAESRTIADPSKEKDVVPGVSVRVGLHRYLWHRVRTKDGGTLIYGGMVLVSLIGGVALVARGRRRRVVTPGSGRRPGERATARSGVSPP